MKYLVLLMFLGACTWSNGDDHMTPIDAGPRPGTATCNSCKPSELCVETYDEWCRTTGPHCYTTDLVCGVHACDPACEIVFCKVSGAQCQLRALCGGEDPNAFLCYGLPQ